MFRRLLVVAGLLVLSGCSAFLATSQQLVYHDEVFEPRRKAPDIAILEEPPTTPYVTLARVVVTQGIFGSRESMMAELRERAAALGADALIDLRVSGGVGQSRAASETTHFAQSGYVSTSESWSPEGRATIRLTISALAIRYQTSE